jgi:hypothetical protein
VLIYTTTEDIMNRIYIKKKEVDGVLMIWWAGRFKKELSLMIVGRTVISIV